MRVLQCPSSTIQSSTIDQIRAPILLPNINASSPAQHIDYGSQDLEINNHTYTRRMKACFTQVK
jgi:hypothetical protein